MIGMTKEKILSMLDLHPEKKVFFCKTDYYKNRDLDKLTIYFDDSVSDKTIYVYKQILSDVDCEIERVSDKVILIKNIIVETPNIPFVFKKNLK